jgi:hypothetical protein
MGSGMKPATKRRVCIVEVEGGIPPKEDSKVYWNSIHTDPVANVPISTTPTPVKALEQQIAVQQHQSRSSMKSPILKVEEDFKTDDDVVQPSISPLGQSLHRLQSTSSGNHPS